MTVISQTRSISCTHTRDLVVYDSTLSISRDNVLRISGGAALGKHGNLFRSLRVPFDGVSPTTLQKGMEQHESSVLDLIDMLEGALEWAVKCTVTFNRFPEVAEVGIFNRVLAEESPVMVHGTARGRRLVVTLYGEDLTPFPYELDMRGFERLQTFKVRMEELIEGFRKHLKHLSSIPVDKILSEVKKNLSANSPYPKI